MNVGVNKINVYKNKFPSGGELDDSNMYMYVVGNVVGKSVTKITFAMTFKKNIQVTLRMNCNTLVLHFHHPVNVSCLLIGKKA